MTAGLGWCGHDRARRPLRGDEIRGCWQAAAIAQAPAAPAPAPPPTRLRDFVPLDVTPAAAPLPEPQALPPSVLTDPAERGTLFELDA